MNNNRHKFNTKKKKPYIDESYVPPFDAAILAQNIEYLRLSEAVSGKLTGAGITTVFEVVRREERDFYRIPTFDRRNLGELKNALNNRRLRLKPPQERPEKTPKQQKTDNENQVSEPKEGARREQRPREQKQRERTQEQVQRGDNRRDNRQPHDGGRNKDQR